MHPLYILGLTGLFCGLGTSSYRRLKSSQRSFGKKVSKCIFIVVFWKGTNILCKRLSEWVWRFSNSGRFNMWLYNFPHHQGKLILFLFFFFMTSFKVRWKFLHMWTLILDHYIGLHTYLFFRWHRSRTGLIQSQRPIKSLSVYQRSTKLSSSDNEGSKMAGNEVGNQVGNEAGFKHP